LSVKKNSIEYVLLAGFSVVFFSFLSGYFIANSHDAAVVALFPLVIWLGVADKKNILFFMLVILPFHSTVFLDKNLLDIPGLKPLNITAFFMLVLFYIQGGKIFIGGGVEKKSVYYFVVYIAIFTLAVLRSLDYHSILYIVDSQFHKTPGRYLLSFLVRPLIFTLPFIYILKHVKTEQDIKKLLQVICFSVFLVSIAVIVIGFKNFDVIIKSRELANKSFSDFFIGMHYNSIGSFYIVCSPLLLYHALSRKPFALINYALAGVAVLLLQSRSTIGIFLMGSMLTLYFLKKWRAIFFFSILLAVSFLLWLPGFIERTLSIGMETRDLNEIFTGRISGIWLPLIVDRLNHPAELFFGVGRYAIIQNPLYAGGGIIKVYHAHNAFIEFLIDNGVILFALLIFFMTKLFMKAWRLAQIYNSDLLWALLSCCVTFIAGSLFGRQFYPSTDIMFLYPVIAVLINYIAIIRPRTT